MSDNKIAHQPEYDALNNFDVEHNVRPAREIAETIAQRHGLGLWHSLVEEISHAIEDAHDIGVQRGQFIPKL